MAEVVPQGRFTLPEELLLLVWDVERGRPGWVHNLGPLLAGALVLELDGPRRRAPPRSAR
jgi:hypothetical protein